MQIKDLFESPETDAFYNGKADAAFHAIYDHVYEMKDQELELTEVVYSGGSNHAFVLPFKEVTRELPIFNRVVLIFYARGYGDGLADITKAEDGSNFIRMFISGGIRTGADILRGLTKMKNSLIHELIHSMDFRRIGGNYDRMIKGYRGAENGKADYFNHPVELNAYFHNVAQPLLDAIKGVREWGTDGLEFYDVDRDFKTYLNQLMKKQNVGSNRMFLDHIRQGNNKKILSRLMKLHDHLWELYDRKVEEERTEAA